MEDGELDEGEVHFRLRSARNGSLPASFSDPLRIHAQCEDYRAGAPAGADFRSDEADRKAGRTLACPMLALWGSPGIPSETSGPLDIWRKWAPQVQGKPIDCGHFLTEEKPEATAAVLVDFFSAA